MGESLPIYCNQLASPPHLCKQTASPLLPCKELASPPLLWNQVNSPLLCAWILSLDDPCGNQHFPHQYILQNNVWYNFPEAGFTSYPNNFTPDLKKIRLIQTIPSIISIGCCAINPELHLSWEGKAKRVVKRDLPFLYILFFLYPCTSGIYFIPLYLRDSHYVHIWLVAFRIDMNLNK